MGRTQRKAAIAELNRKIQICESYKKKLLAYVEEIKNKCLNREITYSEYESFLGEKRDGKTIQEWLEHYEHYIKNCKERIKQIENKAKKKKISFILLSLAVLSVLMFSTFYFRPVIIGLIVQERVASLTQQLNLEFNDSIEYEWKPEYSGRLKSFKISGLIEGDGEIKVYLDNLLVLDSSEFEAKTSKLTGFAIEEAPQNMSPSQEEPFSSEQSEEPAFSSENITPPDKNASAEPEIPEVSKKEIIVKEFKDYCKETCTLDLDKDNYTLKIEISNARLKLQEIKYEIITTEEIPENITVPENITANITSQIINVSTRQYKAVIGKPVKWIKKIELENPGIVKIKLPKEAENITVSKLFGTESFSSVEEEARSSEQSEEPALQSPSQITNEPLLPSEQSKELSFSSENLTKETKFSITTQAISLETEKKSTGIFNSLLIFFRSFLTVITGRAVATEQPEEIELTIDDNATLYEIEYYTEAPQVVEQSTPRGKLITISGPDNLNYTDILAYTYLPGEVPRQAAKLYHLVNGSREEVLIDEYDLNNNSLVDYIEWIVPHLSNQTYELEITIINVKSYPQVGKNWSVMFNTTGKANLTITAFNGTNWSNTNENYDLKFLEVRCGEQILSYEWIDVNGTASVFIQDYECNETAKEISKVLTSGKHSIEFDFGGIKAYAYNTAGILNLEILGSIGGYNASVILMTVANANNGFDAYDSQNLLPPSNSSEFYSNITNGTEYHLVIDAWNDSSLPRTLYLVYSFDATAGAQTGTINFNWGSLLSTNYTGNFTYYEQNFSYLNPVSSVDMRATTTYSDSIASQQKLYIKIIIKEYISPVINITYPLSATYSASPGDLNYTLNASNPDKCWWSNSSGAWNSTAVTCGTNWTTGTGLTANAGSNTWTVYANDTAGILNSSSVTFTLDSSFPNINFTNPTPGNGTTQSGNSIFVNVTANDSTSNISTFIDFDNSLVSWWRMDDVNASGDPTDYTGKNNGSKQGNASQTTAGKLGKGFSFDGNGDYVDLTDVDVNNYLTISCWFKPMKTGIAQYIVAKSDTTEENYSYGLYQSSDNKFGVFVSQDGGTTNMAYVLTDTAYSTTNTWYNVVGVFNGSNVFVYVNGVLNSGAQTGSANIVYNNHIDTLIGAIRTSATTADSFVNGTIDDVMIFNRSLSADEIKGLYANTTSKYLSNNFTSLSHETHTFKAYVQDLAGNVNATETSQVTINTLPDITYVSPIPARDPTEDNFTSIQFNLTMYDTNGVDDLNDTSVGVNFTRGSVIRINNSCQEITNQNTSTSQNYSCSVAMWYWDENGVWNITVYGKDNHGGMAVNSTTNFTYNLLQAIKISPGLITWQNVVQGAQNQTPGNYTTINNTGNANLTGKIAVKGINLYSGANMLGVGNFSVSVFNGTASCNSSANTLVNGTNVTVTGTILNRGNLSAGEANETLHYCLRTVPSSIPSGAYDTSTAGSWYIHIVASIVFVYAFQSKKTKKKKKKQLSSILLKKKLREEGQKRLGREKWKIEKDNLAVALNLLTDELKKEYTKEKQEIIELLIKEIKKKYKLSDEEIKEIRTRGEIKLPITIFSRELGGLEAVVKYTKENLKMRYREIASLLQRNERTIWTAYSKSKEKCPQQIKAKETALFLSSSIFSKKLTILEAVILHLKEKGLRYSEIAKLLERDQRNIWTIYSRAVKKITVSPNVINHS